MKGGGRMSPSLIALIIIGGLFVLYITDIFPVEATTTVGMLAMIFTGVLSFNDAFVCFGSTPVMLTIGMVIIVNTMLESGIGKRIGYFLAHLSNRREKLVVVVVFLVAAVLSVFANNTAVVAMFMPFLTSAAFTSKGKVTRKNTYLPLAIGSLIGGTGSLAGSTAPLLANEVLEYTGSEKMKFFSTAPVAFCIVAVIALCYWLFLYDVQHKCFDFEEVEDPFAHEVHEVPIHKRNAIISGGVFLICIILFIIQPFGWDLGLIAISCATVLVLTGCTTVKRSMHRTPWPAIVTLGAALAIAKGFVASGAGDEVVDWMVAVLGDWLLNPIMLVTVFLIAGFVLSLFMANGSLVSMLCAIAVPLAIEIGISPMPVAMACVFGVSLAMATPVATTTITMVQTVGYRFKDYFRIGGLVGLIGLVTAWGAIVLIYL